jgi:hypothetical protein
MACLLTFINSLWQDKILAYATYKNYETVSEELMSSSQYFI